MTPLRKLQQILNPDRPQGNPYEVWRAMVDALVEEVAVAGARPDLILCVEPAPVLERRSSQDRPFLLLNEPFHCRRLKSEAHQYVKRRGDYPAQSFIYIHVIGLDRFGHLFVSCEFDRAARAGGDATPFTFTFEEDWSKPAPLFLASDLASDRRDEFDVQSFRRKPGGHWFNDDELARLAHWEALVPGFEREIDDWPVSAYIQPLIQRLKDDHAYFCHILPLGGVANYFDMFIFADPRSPFDQHSALIDQPPIAGVHLYFSLLAPVAVAARGIVTLGLSSSTAPPIAAAEVLAPHELTSRFERQVVRAIQATPYVLIEREEIQRAIPPEIVPQTGVNGTAPARTIFELLFTRTNS